MFEIITLSIMTLCVIAEYACLKLYERDIKALKTWESFVYMYWENKDEEND